MHLQPVSSYIYSMLCMMKRVAASLDLHIMYDLLDPHEIRMNCMH